MLFIGVATALAGCSSNAARSLGPDDPRFAKAVDAAQTYIAGHYHLNPKDCGAAAGYHFGVQEDGDRLIVSVKPPKPGIDAMRLSLRRDMSLVEMHPFEP